MAMFERFSNEYNVEIGGASDVCYYCTREFLADPKLDAADRYPAYARLKLKGQLETKKIWRLRDIVICEKHINAIRELIRNEEVSNNESKK